MSVTKEELKEQSQQSTTTTTTTTTTKASTQDDVKDIKELKESKEQESNGIEEDFGNRSSEDTHQFRSPLNSNAIITITTESPLDIQHLLQNHETFELLPSSPPFIKIKFIDKQQAQQLQKEILEIYPDLKINIDFDALTHPGNIYVRGLLPEITTQDLYKIFEPFGEITSLKIVSDEFGRSKGYGFINFVDGQSADEAISKLNGLLVNGSKLYLNHHIAKKERIERMDFEISNFTNLYIKNLPIDYTLEQFEKLFNKFGEINSTFLPDIPDHDHSSKRFGFINFKNHESAIEAIEELHNKEIAPGYILSVSRAQRRDERNDHHHHHHNPFNPHHRNSISPTPAPIVFQSPPIISANPIPTQSLPALIGSPPPPRSALLSTSAASSTSPASIPPLHMQSGASTQPTIPTPNPTPLNNSSTPIIPLPLPGPNHQQSNLYVKNLSPNVDDSALHSAFAPFGIIVSAKVMTTEDGSSRGFGFVCYTTSPEASRALLGMNGNVLDGQVLHVSFAQKNSRRKFSTNGGNNPQRGGAGGPTPVPMDYSFYYNQYQDFGPMYYTSGVPAPGPGGAPVQGPPGAQNSYLPYNVMRPYGNGYNKQPYYGKQSQQYNTNGGYNGYESGKISENDKKIVKLSSEISQIQDEDTKISKISKVLIIPKLLSQQQDGDSNNDLEEKSKEFLKQQVEKYKENGHTGNDVYLDLINDWANDENILSNELEKLAL